MYNLSHKDFSCLYNIIAHNYFGIDAEEVWQIIHTSLNDLKNELDLILKK
jgi:uncharacterized protein with HEPN domain